MVAEDGCLEVRLFRVEELVDVVHPVCPPRFQGMLRSVGGVPCPEDFGAQSRDDRREELVDHARADVVEHLCVWSLPPLELLQVPQDLRGRPICLLPWDAVLAEEVELDRAVLHFDVLHPEGAGAYRVGFVLILLVADPHPKPVDQIADSGDLPHLRVLGRQLSLDLRFNLPHIGADPSGVVVLCLAPRLLDGGALVEPDVLLFVSQPVDPFGHPHRVVVVDDLLPVARRDRRRLPQVQYDIRMHHPRFPPAPQRVLPAPHEEPGRLDHVVREVHLLPVQERLAVLRLQRLAPLLPFGYQRFLLFLRHALLGSLFRVYLPVQLREVRILELRTLAPRRELADEVPHEIVPELPVLYVGRVLLLCEVVRHLLRQWGEVHPAPLDRYVQPGGLIRVGKVHSVMGEGLPVCFHEPV